ncbi:MAG: hypothetical protein IKQ41_13045 [Clostridia bacterium]|nr:hypothetical protein [Clostridia bacterium]
MEAIRGAHAYKMYKFMMLFVIAGVQATQVLCFTYIAMTASVLIPCMGIALLCTFAASLAAEAVLRGKAARETDPNFLLMIGLAMWMCALVLFVIFLNTPGSVFSYISLALCTAGATVCARVLIRMEDDMRRAASFTVGHEPGDAIDRAQKLRILLSSLGGQIVSLIGLTLICLFTAQDSPKDWDTVFRSFSPFLTLPALILVGLAIVFTVKFPLTCQHLEKLRRYMEIRESGGENVPLREQLERVVVQKSMKRYGIKAIIWILTPLCYHRVRGKENVRLDKDIPCVFVCNHGEIYGPVVATLYVPFWFRPWVAYEMTDKNEILDRTMNGVFQNVKRGRKLLNAIMGKLGAPFLAWIMKSVNCIPVYHDNPRKLMQTFRETVTSMQAGDNILLFPENAETSADHRYMREGVSEFFTGFTMIGQMYSSKTGKCPLFIPIYANKRKRTITFGVPTRYNAQISANEEKERLCAYLRDEMLRIAGITEAKPAQ